VFEIEMAGSAQWEPTVRWYNV